MNQAPKTPHEDDKRAELESSQVQVADAGQEYEDAEVDHGYMAASRWARIYRGTLWQMFMFGALSFVGPAMSDAITNLGGAGLSTPYLANLATSLNYAVSAVVTLFGGPLINKIGIKYACIVAAIMMPLAGSGYYVQARYKGDSYLLSARGIGGIGSGFLYVAEATAMLSYPLQDDRGKYLGIWAVMRNSGSVIGGAINFSNNFKSAGAGGVAWSTYLIFIAFECTGLIWALLLSQTRKVRRPNGTHVPMSDNISWKREFIALWKHLLNKRTWLLFVPAFYSFFYGGVYTTYLSLHFSVRARALSSLLQPIVTIVTVMLYGLILDNTKWSQKTRAWVALLGWAIPQAAGFIWTGINYARFSGENPLVAYDYQSNSAAWASFYLPYLLIFVTGYWCQTGLYWMLGTFSTDVKSSSRTGGLFRAFETAGQAVSYAINANTGDKRIPLYVVCALWIITMPCMIALIRLVPETPSDVDDVVETAPVIAAAVNAEKAE